MFGRIGFDICIVIKHRPQTGKHVITDVVVHDDSVLVRFNVQYEWCRCHKNFDCTTHRVRSADIPEVDCQTQRTCRDERVHIQLVHSDFCEILGMGNVDTSDGCISREEHEVLFG